MVDIRHKPGANDKQMFEWIIYHGYRPIIIATKLDKLKRSQVQKAVKEVKDGLGLRESDLFISFSAKTKQGREEIWDAMERVRVTE